MRLGAVGSCPAGMSSLKKERGDTQHPPPQTAVRQALGESERGRERGAGAVIRESPWAAAAFPISAVSALFPGYFALKVIRGEKG